MNSLIFAASKKLSLLNLKSCTSLTTLPGKTFMNSLKTLFLSGCLKLKEFPDIVQVLSDGTDIRELSLAIELLFGLVQLTLNGCKNLERLPRTISALKYLSTLNLSGLSKFREFPEITSSRDQLLEIHLEGTAIRGLPASIELLSGNILSNLKDCKNLKSLPSTINGLRSLRMMYPSGCSKLKNVTETLGKVESLEVRLSSWNRPKMQNDFDCVEQSAVETVTKLAKAELLRDSDSWKKNVDKCMKLSTTATSAC
ncbi:disease resistance protein RPS4-like isoform X2 [Citrus sinensis]|uniref:disease resistance protein RPS4-like isoform X2 n=1 Tax=Citrus sinensis TaxID=2711 RepID=UPI00227798D8|nr:disease resistance protein RPS4-like isoform X2 [Citrus sinensis]